MYLAKTLSYYKRPDIQHALVEHALNKEVAIRYLESFGPRPQNLRYPDDVLEYAKQKATSFHSSEELWENPLLLNTNLRKEELDQMRTGWDFVLDIDCPIWEYSKMIAVLLIKALRAHQVSSISVKFSGNKGFHIGIPFEAFPDRLNGKYTKTLFPEAPKKITQYLIDYINGPAMGYELTKRIQQSRSKDEIAKLTGKNVDELTLKKCTKCNRPVSSDSKEDLIEFICIKCDIRELVKEDLQYLICKKCRGIMEKRPIRRREALCRVCNMSNPDEVFEPSPALKLSTYDVFDVSSILHIDTLLLSSRHLYRMPYSLHEKSWLVSTPIDPEQVESFDKDQALPDRVQTKYVFLDRNLRPGNAERLLISAYDYKPKLPEEKEEKYYHETALPTEAIPLECFPPCIQLILKGLEDGRKRSQFILTNFLSSCGWEPDAIEKLIRDWNKKNREPLKEVDLISHLRYHKQRKQKILPPNCANKAYYVDIGVCKPDNLCAKIKNPVQYAKRKGRYKPKILKTKPQPKHPPSPPSP